MKNQVNNSPEVAQHEVTHEQEYARRVEKMRALRGQGIEPWPNQRTVTATCAQVFENFQDQVLPGQDQQEPVSLDVTTPKQPEAVAGRIMTLRGHGKALFATIQDRTGRLQVYLKQDVVGEEQFNTFQKDIDLGDYVWFAGVSFRTRTGEITLKVDEFELLSKCLHPLPEKFHGVTDIEIKYRQRYLDLMTHEDTRNRFIYRSKIISGLRAYLDSNGFIEVETPMLHPIPGGATARPFVTHHNALDDNFYLRIAPELYLKQLVIGGFERVYEINRNFRNEGVSTRHNPEFTMLEFYMAHENYLFIMEFVEKLIKKLVYETHRTLHVPFGQHTLDFEKPFDRLNMHDAIVRYSSITAQELTPEAIAATMQHYKLAYKEGDTLGSCYLKLFEEVAESKLIQPTFIIDFPIEVSPLSKRDPQRPHIAARFELFIAGMEISNGFNELNDPFDQAERFREQAKAHAHGDEEAMHYDAAYITALEYGLPPTVGVGIGIDRLVMLLTNTTSIKEVILFPTLKRTLPAPKAL